MARTSPQNPDVLIIGGGIIGCSIAWRLAQAGTKVTVLDRSEPGREASSAAGGMLAPLGEMIAPRHFAELCFASLRLYPQFVLDLEEASGRRTGYRRDGSLLVALEQDEEEDLRNVHRLQTTQGFELQLLSAAEVHERVGGVSPQVRCGLFMPSDHWIDNERLMGALLAACRRAGVNVEAGCEVHTIHVGRDRIEGIIAGNGTAFTAQAYVVAAGSWSGKLAEKLGMYLPVTPCCGQMMEFEVAREWPFVIRAGIHYLVPRSERRLLLGTTSEYTGFEKAVTAQGLLSILQGAARLAPQLSEWRFLRAWAGLRPDTADHLPILGYGNFENLLLATGHFRNGILLAPLTAEIVAELVLKGSASQSLEPYRPTRFARQGEQVGRQQQGRAGGS